MASLVGFFRLNEDAATVRKRRQLLKLQRFLIILTAALIGCAAVADPDKPADGQNAREFRATGSAFNINKRAEVFDISDHGDTFTILADRATIQLNKDKFGTVADIKENAQVRVTGEQLSPRTVLAATIVLLDDSGSQYGGAIKSYAPNDRVETTGFVISSSPALKQIDVRTRSGNYVVAVDARTVIRRYIYSADLHDIRNEDSLNIVGTMDHSGRIVAERIQIALPHAQDRSYYPIGKDYTRSGERRAVIEDVVEGVVANPASKFDRTLGISTKYGDRKIDVAKDAEVFIDKRAASVHDLMKGDKIRAMGVWDGSTLIASRVETISSEIPESPRPEPSAKPEEKPAAATNDKPLPNSFTGRIIEIDYATFALVVDSEMRDLSIDAKDTPVTKAGSSRRFSELKKGDKVTVKGEWTDSVLKANSIEIVE